MPLAAIDVSSPLPLTGEATLKMASSRNLKSPTSPSSRSSRSSKGSKIMLPRSAKSVNDYFDVDFSFLEDEPPPGPAAELVKRESASPRRGHRVTPSASSSGSSEVLGDDALWDIRRRTPRSSTENRTSAFRNSMVSDVFPSRPSSSGGRTRQEGATFPRAAQRAVFDSEEHDNFDDSSPVAFRGSLYRDEEAATRAANRRTMFDAEPESRIRLAQFLSETAAAMEGGRSLAMVHPEIEEDDDDCAKSLFELSLEAPGPTRPLSSDESSRDSQYSIETSRSENDRQSTYWTPELRTQADFESEPHSRRRESSQADRTPVVPRRRSHSVDAITKTAVAAKGRVFEKRARIIKEMVETESKYATDMAVVRDIYLARARGISAADVADHVMSTGLGLHETVADSPRSMHVDAFPASPSECSRRPKFHRSGSSGPLLTPRVGLQPVMPQQDLQIIFANLEQIAGLAETFAEDLDNAWGSSDIFAEDDRIGAAFLKTLPRIQEVYSVYCAKHHRAIVRLQELEPTLRGYLAECKTLSHGRTTAWDLASLLIKPVQRCLKYPLLLEQLLSATPESHPDYQDLTQANTEMLLVAERINEFKRRTEIVNRVVRKDAHRRESAASSSSSFSKGITKKLMRSGQKAKVAVGIADPAERDEMFDSLAALVDSTRSGVLRFSNEMREWTRGTKTALVAQKSLVESWIDLYAPLDGETVVHDSHRRLHVYLDTVLKPVMGESWKELDREVRKNLLIKTDHLLSLFENPRSVIAKRNDKMLDHSRYLAKKNPADRRGSEEFVCLSTQLLEELPRFLSTVSRYFNIIVGHFATAQANYHRDVKKHWSAFAAEWLHQIPTGEAASITSAHSREMQPVAQMMETLATGLGINERDDSPGHSMRPSISSSTGSLSTHRSMGSCDSSFFSARSSSSFGTPPSVLSSGPLTPPCINGLPRDNGHSGKTLDTLMPLTTTHHLAHSLLPALQPLAKEDARELDGMADVRIADDDSLPAFATPRRRTGRQSTDSRELTSALLSVYLNNDAALQSSDSIHILYVAEATASYKREGGYRGGYPIHTYEEGDKMYVEAEEADSSAGGAGWLLCRNAQGMRGYIRTETFCIAEDED